MSLLYEPEFVPRTRAAKVAFGISVFSPLKYHFLFYPHFINNGLDCNWQS
jgi:hypothetical protein